MALELPIGANGEVLWLPTDIGPGPELTRILADPTYVVQEKQDGIHKACTKSESSDKINAYNRKGGPNPLAPALAAKLASIPRATILDAEELHFAAGLVIFDLLQFDGRDLRNEPYCERYRIARDLLLPLCEPPVTLAEWITDEADKVAFLEALRTKRAEGAIFKSCTAPYRPGRPTDGGPMRRLKFKQRAEIVCQRRPLRTGETRSFDMFVFTPPRLQSVGRVSARHFYDDLKESQSAIAEVEYLYATPDNKLYQPVFIRWRPDKTLADCTLSQFVLGGRFTRPRRVRP